MSLLFSFELRVHVHTGKYSVEYSSEIRNQDCSSLNVLGETVSGGGDVQPNIEIKVPMLEMDPEIQGCFAWSNGSIRQNPQVESE